MDTFTVFPMSQAVNLEAGEVFEGTINIANPADAEKDFEYYVSVSPYSVIDENYTADLETVSDSSQIVNWIQLEETNGVVSPNETKQIHFRIEVPDDAPAGGQYAAITVGSNVDVLNEENTGVQNVFEIASILFAEVKGETVHAGSVLDNQIPIFVVKNPFTVSTMLKNEGNVHELAKITITAKNVFTQEQVFFGDNESTSTYTEYIMPGTTRYLTRTVNNLSDLGIYEISQSVEYMGKTSETTNLTFVCPVWFLILIVMTLAALVWTFVRMILHRKRQKL